MYTTTQFVHLHNHSLHSSLDGCASTDEYANECAKRGYPAMAITEHGHMASVPDMYFSFKKVGVKAIYGCEIYFNNWEPERQRLEASGIKIRSPIWRRENFELANRITKNRHLTVLAKNQTGFSNLIKLTTQAYETGLFGMGVKQFNRVWFDKLCEYKEGLIILSGCLNGPVAHELRFKELKNKDGEIIAQRTEQERIAAAAKYIRKFKKEFGDNYRIELQMPGVENDEWVFRTLIMLADFYKIKIALTNDVHYMKRKDFSLQKLMMAIAQETTVNSPNLFHVNSDEQYMKTRPELWARFKNFDYSLGIDDGKFEEMCDNTLEIGEQCEHIKFDSEPKSPKIVDADTELRKAVAIRLRETGLDKDPRKFIIDGNEVTHLQQAIIEVNRFIDKGFASYFMITSDLVRYGKSQSWPFGPRGCSIPTSLVNMADGSKKPIIDVTVDDLVLDGFGDVRIVEDKFVYDVDEELIEIEIGDRTIVVTSEHKLYVVRDGKIIISYARDIVNTDEVIELC